MPASWVPAYVGAGSNLDDPQRQVELALARLAEMDSTRLVAVSPLYAGPPMGPSDQPDYVNAAAALLTRLAPESLLSALQSLELRLGRSRDGSKWGPRRIDLDLLLHGDTVRQGDALTLPHPGLAERCFVLRPLTDLAPELRLPDGRRVSALLQALDCSQLRKLCSRGDGD